CNPGADKLPGESSVNSTNRAGGPIDWKPLTATKGEIEAIEKLFKQEIPAGKYLSLTQERATEAAIRREMSKHRYLHFATHGFFAAPGKTLKPGLAANEWVGESVRTTHANPNLMCGLVCAGANKPTPDDDGILTAQEILELNLDGVELAVLSACEANVGKSGAGDFIVGLQKAFQSAGARTTVASLWKVPDNANSILLSRFYENVFKKHLPALEALRETQLWVLNNGVKAGILSEEPKDGERTPPLYWAASSLAGDWR
ncbi:MAG TPA: CHAT domain-containing protein, partial [Gemmata sp.]|nr:CHAT domain-containing protein [Gemmata sp.]